MSTTLTVIDSTYTDVNDSTGKKRLFATLSLTNPYTTGGDLLTVSSYFPNKFLSMYVGSVQQNVSAANAGVARTATARGDTSGTTSIAIQLWNAGLPTTSSAGLFVDNTVSNISNITFNVELIGY